jgi:membrane carboxypeptidase/penicillin-binding protein PbpC
MPFDFVMYQQIERILTTSALQREKIGAKDCCVMVMDGQGEMLSMNNCRAWEDKVSGKVNSCTAKRQTGSAMKPFLYIRAMQQLGLSPDDTIMDEEVEYVLDGGAIYAPKNFDLQYHGEVSLTTALASSLNIPAVRLLDEA